MKRTGSVLIVSTTRITSNDRTKVLLAVIARRELQTALRRLSFNSSRTPIDAGFQFSVHALGLSQQDRRHMGRRSR